MSKPALSVVDVDDGVWVVIAETLIHERIWGWLIGCDILPPALFEPLCYRAGAQTGSRMVLVLKLSHTSLISTETAAEVRRQLKRLLEAPLDTGLLDDFSEMIFTKAIAGRELIFQAAHSQAKGSL